MVAFGGGVLLAMAGMRLMDRRLPAPASEPTGAALREENASLRQLQAVDRQAQASLRRQIARLSAQNGELNRRLALLRGALVPDGAAPQVGIGDLQLATPSDAGQVAYRLLVVRTASAVGKSGGRAQLWGLGELDGRRQEIRLAQLPLTLEHVQTHAGTLVLPAGFRPERLRVVLEPHGQAPLPFEFAWPEFPAAISPVSGAISLP